MAKRAKKRCEQLPILHPDAAGIDVSASELFIAVSPDRDPQPVRSFPTFTRDLNALADWLQQCGIRSVAMESTSVYWIPVYQILESRGLEVCLVNAQHVKNVPGRSRVATALRMAANSLHHAKDYLGEFFRRITRKLGKPQAITATAHKLARIVYHLLGTREAYDESVFHRCDEEALKRARFRLRRQAAQLGFQVIPLQNG
jgi:hypothetical protein